MPRVLITGAAGFIGMHSCIKFLREGWEVYGIDNVNDYYSVSLKRKRIHQIQECAIIYKNIFRFYEADINSDVWNEFESVDFQAIVHLAAQAGVRYSLENPEAYLQSNILGFQAVLNFVQNKGIVRFLYASSSSVYGKTSLQPFKEDAACDKPESYYAATKRMNELMAKSYYATHRMASIGLRFFTVYGPWGRPDMAPMIFANSILKNKNIDVYNYGKQKRDFTYIGDIVESIYLLITREKFPEASLICNIGNGRPVGLMEFISILEKAFEKTTTKSYIEAQKGDVVETWADVSLLREYTGYSPKTGIESGVSEFVKWYKYYYKKNG